jgi:hypothetical protein
MKNRHCKQRSGYTLAELVLSVSTATVLLAGMGSSVYLANQSFRSENSAVAVRSDVAFTEQEMLADLQLATGFTERSNKAVAFTVPDRDGDNQPETLRYAWSGKVGDPLTFSYNGGAVQILVKDVRNLAFDYQTQTLPAIPLPAELTGSTILLIVSDSSKPSARELSRKSLIESWNYVVTLAGLNDTETTILDQASRAQAIYICSTIDADKFSSIATQLAKLQIGIVNETPNLVDEFGMAETTTSSFQSSINIENNAHYIATGLNTGSNSIYSVLQTSYALKTPSSDVCLIGSFTAGVPALGTISKNKLSHLGTTIPGRRVSVPWGSTFFDPISLKNSGSTLMKQAVEWASGLGADPTLIKKFGQQTVLATTGSSRRVQLATRVQLTESGTLKSISAYLGGAADDAILAIYSDKGGEPDKLLVQTSRGKTTSSMSWLTLSVPDTQLSPGYYWLAESYKSSSQMHAFTSSGVTVGARNNNNDATSNGFSSSWGTSTMTSTGARSIYATYSVP